MIKKMLKNYASFIGRVVKTVVGVKSIKNIYTQTVDLTQDSIKDADDKFALRPGAMERLKALYVNSPDVQGRINFINSVTKTGLSTKDIDKSYLIDKVRAIICFVLSVVFVSFSLVDFVHSSGSMIFRDLGALFIAIPFIFSWVNYSLTTFQYRTYNKCTFKLCVRSEPQWWSEVFKAKQEVSPWILLMEVRQELISDQSTFNKQITY